MKNKIPLIIIFSVIISGCTAFNNPFKKEMVTLTSFCELDLDKKVELERMSFRLPKAISSLEPCQAGKMMHDLTRDHKDFFTRFLSFENHVYTSLGTMELRAEGDLFILGTKIETPDEWLARHKKMWKSSYRDDRPVRRKIKRVKLNDMECFRIYKTHHIRKYYGEQKVPDKLELSSYYLEYVCWDASAETYPPLTISAGVGFAKGKTTFPYDMDKDILMPVFRTLKLKKLNRSEKNRRIQKYQKRRKESCNRLIEASNYEIKHNKYHEVGVNQIQALNDCGYNTVKFRKWWCDKIIEVSKGDIKKSKYRDYTRGYFESIKECTKN